jgi:hypothetical protein
MLDILPVDRLADRPRKQAVAWHWVTIMSSPKKMEVGT